MGWESSDVFRFNFGPPLQGQTRVAKLKRAYNFFLVFCFCFYSLFFPITFVTSGGREWPTPHRCLTKMSYTQYDLC